MGVLLIGAVWTVLAESTVSNVVFTVGILICAYAIIVGISSHSDDRPRGDHYEAGGEVTTQQ